MPGGGPIFTGAAEAVYSDLLTQRKNTHVPWPGTAPPRWVRGGCALRMNETLKPAPRLDVGARGVWKIMRNANSESLN